MMPGPSICSGWPQQSVNISPMPARGTRDNPSAAAPDIGSFPANTPPSVPAAISTKRIYSFIAASVSNNVDSNHNHSPRHEERRENSQSESNAGQSAVGGTGSCIKRVAQSQWSRTEYDA